MMTEDLLKSIWELSPLVKNEDAYAELTRLTSDLIKQYNQDGRLDKDPFSPTRERKLQVPFEKIHDELKDRTCVVTGGLGCVGSILVKELLEFDVKSIIVLDNNKNASTNDSRKVFTFHCDIRNG